MKISIIVAHPDDEVLGCGGTIAKLSQENDIYTLILGEGITSRDIPEKQKRQELTQLINNAKKANKILGVKKVYFETFPDNQFDKVPILNIVKVIERHIQKINPEVIYTHHFGDLNIDHQMVHKAVLTAARPIENYSVKKLLACEILSSSEWGYQQKNIFIPNTYVNISETINKKLEAMKCYKSEIRDYPHPRSIDGIKVLAKKRGLEVGLEFAEAFTLIRAIE